MNTTTQQYHTPCDYHGCDLRGSERDAYRSYDGWKIERDGSVTPTTNGHLMGAEVISPILKGRPGLDALEEVMDALLAYGCKINKSCGTHVHHGITDLNDTALKNIYAIYQRGQTFINSLLAPSRRGQGYATPLRTPFEDLPGNGGYDAQTVLRSACGDHYHALNFGGFVTRGTVEFRQHQGSVDFIKIKNWIILTQQIVEAAKIRKHITRDLDAGRFFEKLFMTKHYATINSEEVYIEPSDELVEARKFFIKRARALA